MKKQMISFADPQIEFLKRHSKRLGISVAELTRRLIQNQIEFACQGRNWSKTSELLHINGIKIPIRSVEIRFPAGGLRSAEIDLILCRDHRFNESMAMIVPTFVGGAPVFITLGTFPYVVAGHFLIGSFGGDVVKMLSTGYTIGLP